MEVKLKQRMRPLGQTRRSGEILRFIAPMNDADHVTAETDEFTPRVHFLINPNDGSLCLIRGLVSPGRSMAPHNQSDIELQMRA